MSSRNNPFQELERFFERMSRQFEDTSQMWETDGPLSAWSARMESMAIDLVEQDDAFVATVDLPGFERDDIEISVTDHTLHIEAEHEEHIGEEEGEMLHSERHHESTERSIQLPGEVDLENVEAYMKNGVLTITLPKLETETSHSIEIEVE